jgi:hypothetical protein
MQDVPVPPDTSSVRLERQDAPLRWYAAVEGGVGTTEDPSGVLGVTPPVGVGHLLWDENDYSAHFGVRVTAGRYLRSCERLEARGFWLHWQADSLHEGQFAYTQVPGGPLLLSPGVGVTLENKTTIWGGEVTWWRTLRSSGPSRLELGLGGRLLRVQDRAIGRDWVGLTNGVAELEGKADSTLWAAQGAAAWRLGAWKRFEVAVLGKGMVGLLDRDLREHDTSIVTGGTTTDAHRERTQLGWALEGEIQATFRPVRRVGITAAYSLLLIGDVTRANEMLDFSQAATGSLQIRDTKSSLLVHALWFGVRIDV